ncbi:MAG: hypothetical protein ACRBBO_01685 [Cognatishimia sp.]
MQVVLHFGAPYTDENRLQLCLGKNREALAEAGTVIPRPSAYRRRMKPVINRFKEGTGDDELRMEFFDEVVGDREADRVVFSMDNFLGVPRLAVSNESFFPGHFNRIGAFLHLFDGADVELYYAICNPANFVQGLMKGHQGEDINALLSHSDPMNLRWSEFMERLCENFPTTPVIAWCNEDTPLIWDKLIRDLAGVDDTFDLRGNFGFIKEIMSDEGFSRFSDFLKQRPDMSGEQKQRVTAAFLEKFAVEDVLEEDIDYPGWTDEHVAAVTEMYEADVDFIQTLPNVRFLQP